MSDKGGWTMAALRIGAAALTHQGAVRAGNEDTIALGGWVRSAPMAAPERLEHEVADALPVLALVADGMGGHAAGEVASRVVAERLVAQAAKAVDERALAALLLAVNGELFELMRRQPALDGMGTTVAGVVVLPVAAGLVFNVGDSRVYRVDAAGLEQLSTDDTPGPKLADGRTAAGTSHLITQTLGGYYHDDIVPHVLRDPAEGQRRYLICSDGVSDLLSLREIEALLGDDAGASVVALFEAAMARGGRDNISIVVLEVIPD